MKSKLIILLIPILFGCSSSSEQKKTIKESKEYVQIPLRPVELQEASEPLDWQSYQDSLRTELLNSKPDNFLKGSLLEELYIRNIVTISEDSIFFEIPFNLHSLDCGTSDCYSTDLKFSIQHKDQLVFPNKFTYKIHEHGCVDTEIHLSGTMNLLDQGDNYVSYYSPEHQEKLIIVGDHRRKEYAYLFKNIEPDSIKVADISELLFSLPDTASAPYRSIQLLTNEYEYFLN